MRYSLLKSGDADRDRLSGKTHQIVISEPLIGKVGNKRQDA